MAGLTADEIATLHTLTQYQGYSKHSAMHYIEAMRTRRMSRVVLQTYDQVPCTPAGSQTYQLVQAQAPMTSPLRRG